MENLKGEPIVSISQRNSGYNALPEDLLNPDLNLRKLDLSDNSIHKLMGRLLRVQAQLEELRLADNLLGDNLNPIFSSNEFHGMKQLKLLDLSRNGLRSLEEGIFKGCESLEQLYLDGNNLTTVPTMSLKGLGSIRVLSLSGNNIGTQRNSERKKESITRPFIRQITPITTTILFSSTFQDPSRELPSRCWVTRCCD